MFVYEIENVKTGGVVVLATTAVLSESWEIDGTKFLCRDESRWYPGAAAKNSSYEANLWLAERHDRAALYGHLVELRKKAGVVFARFGMTEEQLAAQKNAQLEYQRQVQRFIATKRR